MEFFLDTASIDKIRHWAQFGLVDGVTTNPVLLASEGTDPISRIKEIAQAIKGPVSAQVTLESKEEMLKQALKLSNIAENVVVKIPASLSGYYVAEKLAKQSLPVNITIIFHPTQALPFIKLGCDYISLFVAVTEDSGIDNTPNIANLINLIELSPSLKPKLISASIRTPGHLMAALNSGSHIVTVPPVCWENVFANPLYLTTYKNFMNKWSTLPSNLRKQYENVE